MKKLISILLVIVFGNSLFAGTLIDPKAIDDTVEPCNDFYAYACGTWIKNTEIPGDKPDWGRTMAVIAEDNLKELKQILENYQNKNYTPANPFAQKLGDYYAACMAQENNTDPSPDLAKALARIDQIKNLRDDLAIYLAEVLLSHGISPFFGFGVSQNPADATQHVLVVWDGGLTLPEREYYLSDDNDKFEIRREYVNNMAATFELLGFPTVKMMPRYIAIRDLEKQFAQLSLDRVQVQDPNLTFNPIGKSGLKKLAPSFSWDVYFNGLGLDPAVDTLIVSNPKFFSGFELLLKQTSINTVKDFLRWNMIHGFSTVTNQQMKALYFDFYGKRLTGQQKPSDRWKICVSATSGALDETLGRSFVELKFAGNSKTSALEMLTLIRQAFNDNLSKLPWLDSATAATALDKSNKIVPKIGYPDKWQDISDLQIVPDNYMANILATNQRAVRKNFAKLGSAVDRTEWFAPPQEVNAFYNPQMNEIIFPAGILQSPLFDATAPLWENLGAIGVIVGHELTHGFDNIGSRFDSDGNLRDWWTQSTQQAFEGKKQCLIDQFSKYQIEPGVFVKGDNVISENIADLGGMKFALHALRSQQPAKMSVDDKRAQTKDFFLAYAQAWCSKASKEYENMLNLSDSHALPRFRVNGVVSNRPEFAEAFQCQAGAPMAPVQRCEVW